MLVYKVIIVLLIIFAIFTMIGVLSLCHKRAVDSEIAMIKKSSLVKKAKRRAYTPIGETIEFTRKDKYLDFKFETEILHLIDKDLPKIQARLDLVVWWLDFLDTEYRKEINRLSKQIRTKEAKRYLDSTVPSDLSIVKLKKVYRKEGLSEKKDFTLADVDRLMQTSLSGDRVGRLTETAPKVRYKVIKRDDFTCQVCGRSSTDLDLHVMPKNESKGLTEDNLFTICEDCLREMGNV